jgi:hypothetical protein
MGFEPMIRVLQTLALASWPRRLERLHFIKDPCAGQGQKKKPLNQGFLERAMGLEPTTFSLARRHSTN